ncbi:exonuclease SbcCD subunit D [Salinibacterium sp. ZJ450]|uniref:exonuclease SbcCD subunit D n=1 Tax=Salinibacterium sp. ZJ450 TaxID=2708338 RepID=UPI0014222774|nr:exonuclease SbcCD subunit D [Salinibacterium sp. ZJ450]
MRILHTSDWHIGRTFHGHATVDALRTVLTALVDVVRDRAVDVVLVSGDVFDSATPAADYFDLLTEALRAIRQAGASVIVSSGNHDSAKRLGFQAEFAGLGGVHVITRVEQHDRPVTIGDAHGPVHFYGIPYMEPALIRHLYPDETLRTHEQALGFAMRNIRADAAERGGRSVVLSHCFAAGVAASDEATDVERDITAGGLDVVPLSVFDGPDYVALGHIHGRSQLSERVRYSGAPLHYSFAEAGKPRGVWLVELDATGLASVDWVDLPVPRRLSILTGTIDELLTDAAYREFEDDWVSAILTDQARPIDAMRRLQERFPGCAKLEHRPAIHLVTDTSTYAERVNAKSDHEIVGGFLELVRNGVGATEAERAVIGEVIAAERATEASA